MGRDLRLEGRHYSKNSDLGILACWLHVFFLAAATDAFCNRRDLAARRETEAKALVWPIQIHFTCIESSPREQLADRKTAARVLPVSLCSRFTPQSAPRSQF
jgi:hypothetical protein